MRASKPRHEPIDIKQALQYVSTLSASGSAIVPADEDGREARSAKYLTTCLFPGRISGTPRCESLKRLKYEAKNALIPEQDLPDIYSVFAVNNKVVRFR